jgi:hypothetical protein
VTSSPGPPETVPRTEPLYLWSYVGVTGTVSVVLGLVGGFVWAQVASPPAALRTSTGLVLGETQLDQQVGVTMWFLLTGAALGILLGYAVCWKGSTYGVLVVAATVAAAALACLVSYWSGVHLFGPDPPGASTGRSEVTRVVVTLSVGTDAAYLGWPIGALVGAIAAISAWPRDRFTRFPATRQERPTTHRAEALE